MHDECRLLVNLDEEQKITFTRHQQQSKKLVDLSVALTVMNLVLSDTFVTRKNV